MPSVTLPTADGGTESYAPTGTAVAAPAGGAFPRVAYAAAHVVADPRAMRDPWLAARDRLGRHARLPPPPLGARLQGRRGDGHVASAAWASTGRPPPS